MVTYNDDMVFAYLLGLFLLGMVLGALVGLPYGPGGFLVIRRFYLFGMRSGMYSALGMVLSDTFYAVIVGFGLKHVLRFVSSFAIYGEFILGILVIAVGVRSMTQKLELQIDEEEKHPTRDIASTFFINVLNPSLVFWFALAFEIIAKLTRHPLTKIGTGVSIGGVVVGACLLWFLIGRGIRHLRRNNRDELVQKINYVTGGIIAALGVVVLVLAIISLF